MCALFIKVLADPTCGNGASKEISEPILTASYKLMDMEEREDKTIYKVVVNHEEQYSIWPESNDTPSGWTRAGVTGGFMFPRTSSTNTEPGE